ncbi:kinase-like domain-containing protein [Lyophyllum atratum]|nr:kinase-like domain-containing protein [Lyophyllum atratum]
MVWTSSRSLVVKSGSRASIREAMAMMYIQQRTSIPVPKVHMCFQHNDHTYIVMDRIKGQPLEVCLSSMTEQQLRSVATQLAGFVRELGTLESDTRRLMGSWPSGPYDNLLFDPPPLHEFRDLEAFHSYWIWRLGSQMTLSEVPSALCEVGRQCNVVLAHGDLNDRNIMVDDGTITGLVDWETLGWYPDFWELMAALRGSSTPKWCDELSIALGPESDLSLQYTSVLYDVFFRLWAD